MRYTPRNFQTPAIDHAVQFLLNSAPGDKQLYAAPTGTGKSIVELVVQEQLAALGHSPWIVTPRDEIVTGMMDKLGATGDMLDHRISTPIKLRNRLMDGRIQHPTHLIVDESHHVEAETYKQLDLLTGLSPSVGYTATPYRGSPKSTKSFRDAWGEPLWLITYAEAIQEKLISMPCFEVLPLVDDDVVEVRGGEFEVTSLESATIDRLGDVAEQSLKWFSNSRFDKPTIYALPNSLCCNRLQQELGKRGIPSFIVSAATPRDERKLAFDATVAKLGALLHVQIVQEGVDLPLRRLVDLAPTMSPVKWVQQLGRITRPTDEQPEYVGCNRNLMRHAYVLEGVIRSSVMEKADKAFPSTQRAHARVLGLEAIGRFKPTSVKLLSGLQVHIYSLTVVVGTSSVDYCVVVHPSRDPVWAVKVNSKADGVTSYGRWMRCEAPETAKGFGSVAPRSLSEKQAAWWKRGAHSYGLDPNQEVDRKQFQVLPVLADLGVRL